MWVNTAFSYKVKEQNCSFESYYPFVLRYKNFVPSFCFPSFFLIMARYIYLFSLLACLPPSLPLSDQNLCVSLHSFLSAVDGSASVCGRFVKLFELSGSLVRLISLRTPDGGEEREPCGGHPAHTHFIFLHTSLLFVPHYFMSCVCQLASSAVVERSMCSSYL